MHGSNTTHRNRRSLRLWQQLLGGAASDSRAAAAAAAAFKLPKLGSVGDGRRARRPAPGSERQAAMALQSHMVRPNDFEELCPPRLAHALLSRTPDSAKPSRRPQRSFWGASTSALAGAERGKSGFRQTQVGRLLISEQRTRHREGPCSRPICDTAGAAAITDARVTTHAHAHARTARAFDRRTFLRSPLGAAARLPPSSDAVGYAKRNGSNERLLSFPCPPSAPSLPQQTDGRTAASFGLRGWPHGPSTCAERPSPSTSGRPRVAPAPPYPAPLLRLEPIFTEAWQQARADD